MTTAVYIRVSSPKGQKTDSQRVELEAWLKRQRTKGARWFEDRESATTLRRDAFQKLQAAIFAGQIDTVVVWKLDRLARSLKEGVNILADWCQRGVRVIAITQQIDLGGPVGNLIASLLFGIAEIELQHSKERQAIGIALAKKRGVLHWTPAGHNEGYASASTDVEKTEINDSGNRTSARRQRAHRLQLPQQWPMNAPNINEDDRHKSDAGELVSLPLGRDSECCSPFDMEVPNTPCGRYSPWYIGHSGVAAAALGKYTVKTLENGSLA